MMNPLKQMDTTAMKTVQKSAVKKLSPNQEKLDKNKSGDLDSQDFKMLRSSNKMQPSGLKAMDGSNMKSEKSTPLFVNSPAKEKENKAKKQRAFITQALDSFGDAIGSIKLPRFDPKKFETKSEKKARLENEAAEKTKVKKKETVTVKAGTEANKLMNKIMKDSQAKKAASSSGEKTTYSQAWDKMTDAAKGKYESKADFIKAAKAYNVKIGKTKATTGTKTEKETETKTKTETGKVTGTVTDANKISGKTGTNNTAADVLQRAKESAEKKKKEEEARKKAAAEEAKKNKKLTPKEKRKAERNIKAQEKANKKIRKGGGQQIKVDEKNTTATASDRRKLKQGAKRLEQKLSLAQKEIDRKNKKKKEDKNKKGKEQKNNTKTSKTSKSFI